MQTWEAQKAGREQKSESWVFGAKHQEENPNKKKVWGGGVGKRRGSQNGKGTIGDIGSNKNTQGCLETTGGDTALPKGQSFGKDPTIRSFKAGEMVGGSEP